MPNGIPFLYFREMEWFLSVVEKTLSDSLLLYAIPVFFIAMGVEWYIDRREQKGWYDNADVATSVSMGFLSMVVEFMPKVLFFLAFEWLHSISPFRDVVGRQWWAWGLLLFADDLSYYWFHRLNHEVRIFWAGHVSHHSSVKLNLGTALRQGVGERLHKFVFWLWIPLLGFDGLMIFTMMAVNLIYQFYTHSPVIKRMPSWFEGIFNTPSHHRVHHASNIRYLDRNHAGVFIIWDRLFGTFSKELDEEKPIYGLTKNIERNDTMYVATHEYQAIWRDVQRAEKWSDKLKYIFYPPGWSHDGSDQRAKTLRKQAA